LSSAIFEKLSLLDYWMSFSPLPYSMCCGYAIQSSMFFLYA
jgi:hypothetical protein